MALVVAAAVGFAGCRWSKGWTDRHRLALVAGGVDREHGGRFPANRFTATDLLAKVVLNVAALAGLLVLALRENGHELAAKRP